MEKRLHLVYLRYNRKYFKNKLPKDAEVTWESMPSTLMGYCQGDKIAINDKLQNASTLWRGTLLHECVHLELPKNIGHGPKFKARIRKLVADGAFDGLL